MLEDAIRQKEALTNERKKYEGMSQQPEKAILAKVCEEVMFISMAKSSSNMYTARIVNSLS